MPIPFIIGGLVLLTGAVALDSADQRDKRKRDQKRYRREINKLEKRIKDLEEVHSLLVAQLGNKNAQVSALCMEIKELRAELNRKRRSA